MSLEEVLSELSYPEKRVLVALKKLARAPPEDIMKAANFEDSVGVMSAASWLQSKRLVRIGEKLTRYYSLAKRQWATKNLPERKALKLLRKERGAIPIDHLKESGKLSPREVPIAVGWLKRKGWADVVKEGKETILKITEKGKRAVTTRGEDEKLIQYLAEGEKSEHEVDMEIVRQLLSRQDIIKEREQVWREISLTERGRELLKKMPEEHITTILQRMKKRKKALEEVEVSQITPEFLQQELWKDPRFRMRKYDVGAYAPQIFGGKKHPLTRYIEKIRSIFSQMGFKEIEGNFVESSFWSFEALFVPQDHPARDMQDTFYVEYPEVMPLPDDALVEKVKEMHEHGGDIESNGWGYKWSIEEAKKTILRTHTTANTIRYLSEHSDPPQKVFIIGRNFRREAMDSVHLPEFTQVEGIVMEEGASLVMLIGLLKEFYSKLGYEKTRVRPSYFPYTEPSLEVEVFFNGEWLELGGAGIFRPEVIHPLGVRHPVLAWGLSLERIVMVLEGIKDIRDIYLSDIDWLRKVKTIH